MELPKSGFFSTVFSALLRPALGYLDRHAAPHYDGDLTIAGLNHPVQVNWDRYAVPHVRADNEHDLFLTQGYLHAQERLWQMELSRHFFAGRMAEIFGDFALPWKDLSSQFRGKSSAQFDYFVRLLGIRESAAASLSQMDEGEQLRLAAYSAGVNGYIERCGKKPPWEFRLLRHEPEPWQPLDTLTIGKGLAMVMSTALYSRLNFIALAEKLRDQPAKLHSLMLHQAHDAPTLTQTIWQQSLDLWQFTSGMLAASPFHGAGHGSNFWLVAPHRSATGKAILCNDPHLRLTLPSPWYLMHLQAGKISQQANPYEVWGASIPGLPYIQLGHNRAIAWGITAALCDDVEIYREKLHALDPDLYLAGNTWQRFSHRREVIAIRGQRAVEKIVRQSRHGPVISDFSETPAGKELLALRWAAQEAGQELRSVYSINKAENWRDFLDALGDHSAPSLNFAYADRAGNIGYTLAGKIPRRTAPTLLPLEGWNDDHEWRGYIPYEELPRLFNPPQGVIASANNRIVDSANPHYLSHLFEPPHRVRRIAELLARREKFSRADLAVMQLDATSLHGRELISKLKDDLNAISAGETILKDAANRLLAWDGDCASNSVAAAIFHILHHRLLTNLLRPELGEELFAAYVEILNQCIEPTDRILGDANSSWFENRSRSQLVRQSLREACAELSATIGDDIEQWQWGRIHQLQMNHAFGRGKLLKALLGIGPVAAPGDGMTINFGFYRYSNPYTQSAGATLRCAMELSDPPDGDYILAAGQSGHPTSNHYRDQFALWRAGGQISLSDFQVAGADQRHLLLKPA
ncbi:MAG: penicillin acylase family protein [Deltaproteobacteria bacterium]|nr:penicillin acylase family protein [Deltaproteobacteria bacterium]